ncbi:MAG: TOBE domain-containing protein, partial [Acidobacteria bacterium]|nr:TOBE domain-containing protein [Acidobacteriota bacterium]
VREEFSIPTMYVSHDATEILMLTEEVAVLSHGEVLALGRPGEVLAAPSIFPMARAEGFENLLEGSVVALEEGLAVVELEPGIRLAVPGKGLAMGQWVILGLRAEDLILGMRAPSGLSAQNILPGTVRAIREAPEAGALVVTVGLGTKDASLLLMITGKAMRQLALHTGLPVHVLFKAQACRVLAVR